MAKSSGYNGLVWNRPQRVGKINTNTREQVGWVSLSCNSLDSQMYPFQRGNYVFIGEAVQKQWNGSCVWINSGFGG